MALVVFLRGVNVGGQKRFRPASLARELRQYDVVNIGAAGTFVVRKPGSRTAFLAAITRKLPFEAEMFVCSGRDLISLAENSFQDWPPEAGITRFVSVLPRASRVRVSMPIQIPTEEEWFVRLIGSEGRFVLGLYRRHMKTIGYLGQIDRVFGQRATTRTWNTIMAAVRVLKGHSPGLCAGRMLAGGELR